MRAEWFWGVVYWHRLDEQKFALMPGAFVALSPVSQPFGRKPAP